jgi:hypothetical protein
MTTGGRAVLMQQSRNDEVIGKIFVALSQDMRRCLICDGVFTKQGAAEHVRVLCTPRFSTKTASTSRTY